MPKIGQKGLSRHPGYPCAWQPAEETVLTVILRQRGAVRKELQAFTAHSRLERKQNGIGPCMVTYPWAVIGLENPDFKAGHGVRTCNSSIQGH